MAQHERPELVRGEDGQRGAVDGRERRVLRREHGDAACWSWSVVALAWLWNVRITSVRVR